MIACLGMKGESRMTSFSSSIVCVFGAFLVIEMRCNLAMACGELECLHLGFRGGWS